MSPMSLALLLLSTAVAGLLAGASLDQSVKQLPARHAIGAVAFANYSRASDLGRGVAFYATLGIAALVSSLAVAIAADAEKWPGSAGLAIHLAAALAILHSIVTARAAPVNFSQRRVSDVAGLTAIFDRFARLQTVRCGLQVAAFAADLWALGLAIHR